MKIIGHACGNDIYPELTVASALYSLRAGADLVEMDIRFTADGIPVITHDDNGERLFGENKKIAAVTAEEFRQWRYRADTTFSAYLMEDFLRCGVKNILYHVKEGGARIPQIMAMCKKYHCENSVVLGLEQAQDVAYVKRHSDMKVLAFMPDETGIEQFAEAGADYIRLWEQWLTEENVRRIRAEGKKLWIMSCGKGASVGVTDLSLLPQWRDVLKADGVLMNSIDSTLYYLKNH